MEYIQTDFPEIDIETTVTVLLWRFQNYKMPLPIEVELCPIGLEAEGWKAAARRVLLEAKLRERPLIVN